MARHDRLDGGRRRIWLREVHRQCPGGDALRAEMLNGSVEFVLLASGQYRNVAPNSPSASAI